MSNRTQILCRLSVDAIPTVLAWTALALVLLHLAASAVHYRAVSLPWEIFRLFNVDSESALFTWFSGLVLLLAAGALLLAARSPQATAGFRRAWIGLAAVFAYLSADEVLAIHDSVNDALPFSWTYLGLAAVAALGLLYAPFLLRLPRPVQGWFLAGALLFLGGALGVEILTETYLETSGIDSLGYVLLAALEESLEILGAIAFVHGVLLHVRGVDARDTDVVLSLDAPGSGPA